MGDMDDMDDMNKAEGQLQEGIMTEEAGDGGSCWLKLKTVCSEEQTEALSALFEALGALSVSFTDAGDDPIFEPLPGSTRRWPRTVVSGLFPRGADPEPLLAKLRALLGEKMAFEVEYLPEQDWVRLTRGNFKPQRFGTRLWVCPSWQRVTLPGSVTVVLDPGLAFGTGAHATTALCLKWLESEALDGQTVLDYGCGSGILALSALKLGAAQAIGVDLDPQALIASRANARLNGLEARLHLHEGPEGLEKVPVLVANLLLAPLLELRPVLAGLCLEGAHVALSGLLEDQAGLVVQAYSPDFSLEVTGVQDGWVCLTGVRR